MIVQAFICISLKQMKELIENHTPRPIARGKKISVISSEIVNIDFTDPVLWP